MTAREDTDYENSYDYCDYSDDDEEEEKKEKEAPKAVNSTEVANALAADVAEEVDPDEP